MQNDPRYAKVDDVWNAARPVPPCTHEEAERAARRIYRAFGHKKHGGPNARTARFNGEVRKCWITPKTDAGLAKGWERLVHDIGHRIFAARHPTFRPHAGGHDALERDIAAYVVAQGFLAGKLRRDKPKGRAAPDAKLDAIRARIARWESKARRAETALKKLRRQERYYSAKV